MPEVEKKQTGYIYLFTCVPLGKSYVGATIQPKSREKFHRSRLRGGSHDCKPLQEAWDRYDEKDFVFRIIKIMPETRLENAEVVLIRKLGKTAFNVKDQGYQSTPELRSRQSNSHKGKVGGMLGKHQSAESRALMSIGHTGQIVSQEHRDKISKASKGRTYPERRGKPGHPQTKETREKISVARMGMVFSQETRDKMSANNLGKKLSPETRAKMAKGQKRRRRAERLAREDK